MDLDEKKKVLIVEDELLIAFALKDMLQPQYDVVNIAISFDEAMDALHHNTIDIALLDITLAGEKSGMEVAEEVAKYNIPFIFLTALTHNEGLKKLLTYKPAAYLSKPINKPDLLTAVQLAITNHSTHVPERLEFYAGKIKYSFDLDKLIYIEAEHIYVRLYLIDEKALIRISLSKLVDQSNNQLKRINRKVAVNKNFIRSERNSEIVLKNDMVFAISKRYK